MTAPRTLLDKLWATHEIVRRQDGASLLWVDRHLVHEGSHHAFGKLAARGASVAEPDLTFAVVDHYAPTRRRDLIADPKIRYMVETLRKNTHRHGLRLFDLQDPGQGIVHVIGPEQGLTLPGLLINCGDSHTSTHGAFGALAFGIGATEVAHVLATQTIWQKKPAAMRICVDGTLGPGVTAKDIALNWIARLGADGAQGHALEYTGSAVRALTMEGRMTLCNLSIEGGARFGLIAPDEITVAYVKDRPYAPKGSDWDTALDHWAELASDEAAHFDQNITFDAADIAPTVTWGTSPEQAIPVTATIPDPNQLANGKAQGAREALDYMGLSAGRPIEGTPVDQVFIGSCTNGRIEDLRHAAAVLSGRKAKVTGLVSPGSAHVKAQAEEEGLDRIFVDAGLEWAAAGCSMCVGMNGDLVAPGKRCASSTNRNFRGRQGPGALTHLMSPAMVAAAAVTGTITDVRPLLARTSDMSGWSQHQGHVIALPIHNVDTDQLIPSRFMSTPRNEGYGRFLLHDLRRTAKGDAHPDFPLNRHDHASILVTGRNFGSGSSREAAVYALVDAGVKAVFAPSFGDIFAGNAINNGLLPARISEEEMALLFQALADAAHSAEVCLENSHLQIGERRIGFELDPGWRTKLINGWDDIDLTLAHSADIDRHTRNSMQRAPWMRPAPVTKSS